MNRRSVFRFVLAPLAALAIVAAAYAGGWAVITVSEYPDHAVAGSPLTLKFAVRQHGVTLLGGLQPAIKATASGGLSAQAAAVAGRSRGEYTATLTLPQAGDWTITITDAFNGSELKLPALRVVARGAAAPVPYSMATRGLRLFTTKGCVGCHQHIEVSPEPSAIAAKLDLTGKRFPSDYLRKFLADPGIKPAQMPNLNLNPEEIEAIAVFINKDSKKQKLVREGL